MVLSERRPKTSSALRFAGGSFGTRRNHLISLKILITNLVRLCISNSRWARQGLVIVFEVQS